MVMESESKILRDIRIALANNGIVVWRNSAGCTKTTDGRVIRYGLTVGASDLIGISRDGKFLAIEVKSEKGRVSVEQQKFIDLVIRNGGRAGVARSVAEAVRIATWRQEQ